MIKFGCFIWSKKKLKNSRYTVVVFHIYKILSYHTAQHAFVYICVEFKNSKLTGSFLASIIKR